MRLILEVLRYQFYIVITMAGDDLAQARGQGINSYDIDLPSIL